MARNLEHFWHGMFFQQKIHSTSAPTEVCASMIDISSSDTLPFLRLRALGNCTWEAEGYL
jgi:hypothetical protein